MVLMPKTPISWNYESKLKRPLKCSVDKLRVEPLGQLGKLDLHLVMMIQQDQPGLRRTRSLPGELLIAIHWPEADDRVLAMSAQEADAAFDNPRQPLELDDDEELKRAIAMSEEESRAPKRQKREETPEEERKMLEE
jgi:hypothetical protein